MSGSKAVSPKLSESTLNRQYLDLSSDWELWERPLETAMSVMVNKLSETLHVDRVSIWVKDEEDNGLQLFSLYDKHHQQGDKYRRLHFQHFPVYMQALDDERLLDVVDIYNDYRTREFPEDYLKPLNIGAVLHATLRKAGQFAGVLCVEHAGGQRLWSGDEKRFVVSMADLISQRMVHGDILQKEARYRMLFESAGDSIFLMKGDQFIDCNSATLAMYGCKREQIIGHTPMAYSPEFQPDGVASLQKAQQKIQQALAGETQSFEWRHSKYDGVPFDAEVTLKALTIGNEEYIQAIVRDISHRKQSERELRESRRQLVAQNENLKLIDALSMRLHGRTSVDEIVSETLNTLIDLSLTPYVAIYLLDPQTQQLKLTDSHGFDTEIFKMGENLQVSAGLNGLALKMASTLTSGDFTTDERMDPAIRKAMQSVGLSSGAVIPLMYQDMPLGTLCMAYEGKRQFSAAEQETYEVIGRNMSLSLANARQINELAHMAHHDSLTGLPNRALLHQRFDELQSRESMSAACLMLLDLNRFKDINDTLGHHTGDKLLQQISPRIQQAIGRQGGVVCRLGGDEFTLLLPGLEDEEQGLELADSILARLQQPFFVDDVMLEIDASIGIAMHPRDGKDSHALLRSADVAMYEAKDQGGGALIYRRSTDKHSPERLALTAELGQAIREQHLTLHYQPKVELATGRVSGFEALVRWKHEQLGLLYPDKFMQLAEVGEAIHQLTDNVLQMALSRQQKWRNAGHDYSVAVNLSARNLIDERCVNRIEALLSHYQTPKGCLQLEITETALMQDPQKAIALLNRLAKMGVRLAIDDFGTGYSSLAYLRQLPINALKIDKVFVRDMLTNEQDAIIVRSIIALAHNLKLQVVAEGVEDQATLEALKAMHCDKVQGYHISKPKPWAELSQWLQQHTLSHEAADG